MQNIATRPGFATLLLVSLLAGCGGRAYVHDAYDPAELRGEAETQVEGNVRVSAAIPGREQTEAVFGLPLYDQGIQPVWVEIANAGSRQVRYALSSTDRLYFSPYEVAWKNRAGYSDEARRAIEARLSELAMPRHVQPGELRSGFVYTHASTGAKGFNVDVFDGEALHEFTYLLRVPGFTPDYADVRAVSIYSPDEIEKHGHDTLPAALKALPCCATDVAGNETGEPINVILVGEGIDLLKALLRSNWIETSESDAAAATPAYLFGRQQDAIFRNESRSDDSYYELRVWLTPIMAGDSRVWAGQARHYFRSGLPIVRVDPDVDNARNFAMQNFLYGQALIQFAWVSGREVVAPESFWEKLVTKPYFTDGYRIALWLAPAPVSVLDVVNLGWENPPEWRK